jgi:hypothetical protein
VSKKKPYRDLGKMDDPDSRIRTVVEDFAEVTKDRILNIQPKELVDENGINPLLIWALGIKDFRSLAKFSLYQRLGRSIVTSFGQKVVEEIVRGAMNGEKGKKAESTSWWDSIKKSQNENLYVCVKSGPQNMDDDQVRVFCDKAKEIKNKDYKAVPIIGMCYGRKEWPVISNGLKKRNFEPKKHAFIARDLFKRICNDPNYYERIPNLIKSGSNMATSNTVLIELIDNKVNEITKYFESNYETIEDLLQYVYTS